MRRNRRPKASDELSILEKMVMAWDVTTTRYDDAKRRVEHVYMAMQAGDAMEAEPWLHRAKQARAI